MESRRDRSGILQIRWRELGEGGLMRLTNSLCPVCYRVIPASVLGVDGSVWMEKRCPVHGWFRAMVERDPWWYEMCQRFNCKYFYGGYLIDITDRCNLVCKYCYHLNGGEDYSVESILADLERNKHLAPFSLIGGEPTIHKDLPELLRRASAIAKTTIVSNGIRLCDQEYLDELCKAGLQDGNRLEVGISFHKESKGKDFEFLEICRSRKVVLTAAFFVIDDLSQIDEAIDIRVRYRDVLPGLRIKAASNLGAEKWAKNKIFVSDMLGYMKAKGSTNLLMPGPGFPASNKVSFASILWEGLSFSLVSWYDTQNVDLEDINCGPWYKSKDGKVYNLVTALLLNEKVHGNQKGQ